MFTSVRAHAHTRARASVYRHASCEYVLYYAYRQNVARVLNRCMRAYVFLTCLSVLCLHFSVQLCECVHVCVCERMLENKLNFRVYCCIATTLISVGTLMRATFYAR